MKKHILLAALAMLSLAAMAQPAGGVGEPRVGGPRGGMVDKSSDSTLQALIREVVPQFRQFSYRDSVTGDTIAYNLFVPKDYDPARRYPLVLFMADASTTAREVTAPLTQGYGALEFASRADQQRHPSFVLVPQFQDEVVVNDTFYVSPHVGSVVRLLADLQQRYSIDADRLYTTGQSMGGMISFYLNLTYPRLFAASLFVGSQWDTAIMAPMAGRRFFYIVGGGDPKASKGMDGLTAILRQNEADFTSATWSARLPQSQQEDSVRAMIARGKPINLVKFTPGSVLAADGSGNEHMYSFDHAYRLQGVRDWLFRQVRTHRADSIVSLLRDRSSKAVLVSADRGDWHGTEANSLKAIGKAIAKGADIVTIHLERDSAGQAVAATRPIAEPHHVTPADRGLHLTPADILSFAAGKIVVEFADAADYREEIRAAAKATGTTGQVILGDVDTDPELMYAPRVSISGLHSIARLSRLAAHHPVAISLSWIHEDAQLKKALKIAAQGTRILVDASRQAPAGTHEDATLWQHLHDLGATILLSNQIKPLLRWLGR